ncbi:MAG: DNA mismatch repair protein msh6 [Trizodia sp. TS-e1964]|nr:MAG: DNA mismatch repair protein msh6 [Trizodia sp. TS-e1964]
MLKLTCYPPLGQPTVIPFPGENVIFNAILEAEGSEKWELALWHGLPSTSSWTALLFNEIPKPTALADFSDTATIALRRFYILKLAAKDLSINFTLKFRPESKEEWRWAKDVFRVSDGQLIHAPSKFIASDDLTNHIEGLSPDIKVESIPNEVPSTSLWSLTGTASPAEGTKSGWTVTRLGLPNNVLRWFSLVRLWEPWIAPEHGGTVFSASKDSIMCSFLRADGSHLVLIALSGIDDVLTVFKPDGQGNINIHSRNDNIAEGIFRVVAAVGNEFESTNAAAMCHARHLVMSLESQAPERSSEIKTLIESIKPEWVTNWADGLSYCTWNGLGQNLSEQKIFEALDTLAENNINITNLIIDDNWQDLDHDVENQYLKRWVAFEANKEGFPQGLKHTISQIRRNHKNIKHVAVWHAMLGYWGGIANYGEIVENYKTILVNKGPGLRGKVLRKPSTLRVVDAKDVARFYEDFYQFLSRAGVDSVKTDVQFLLDELEDPADRRGLMTAYQDAWTISSLRWFSIKAISCMSQIPQMLFYSQLPNNKPRQLVRNSDDFFPEIQESHPWHIFCNAHNSLFTQHLNALPDWDMFQTSHPWAAFHAAARCVSGGPIYVTDVPGKHDIALIKQMTATTPKGNTIILRTDTLGKTTQVYVSYQEERLIKIGTSVGEGPKRTIIVGAFNATKKSLSEVVPIKEFPGALESQDYILRAHSSGKLSGAMSLADPSSAVLLDIPVKGWEILSAYALTSLTLNSGKAVQLAALGLLGKMSGAAAIADSKFSARKSGQIHMNISLKALGVLGIYLSNLELKSVKENISAAIMGKIVPLECINISSNSKIFEIDAEKALLDMKLVSNGSNLVQIERSISPSSKMVKIDGKSQPASSPMPMTTPSNPQSSKSQKSILGFFQKKGIDNPSSQSKLTPSTSLFGGGAKRQLAKKKGSSHSLTPAPSSDAIEPPSSPSIPLRNRGGRAKNTLSSPDVTSSLASSPTRKTKKVVSYAESEDEDEEAFQAAIATTKSRGSKRRRTVVDDDEDSVDNFVVNDESEVDEYGGDEDLDDFIIPDELEQESTRAKKRKRPSKTPSRNNSSPMRSPPADDHDDVEMPTVSTAQQWKYDPENTQPLRPRPDAALNANSKTPIAGGKKWKEKAHTTEPEQRYPWLANMTDIDRNPPGHPDYDPRTVYIPPLAWSGFSAFEKQYWEIKQKFWDTIVFFKKGKFYELYENDATIGHQLFDLKLTDRVNMRMVGVPEMSLDHWANQFVAKGYKIARVDQMESALGKEMRERDGSTKKPTGKPQKADKIIHRELACVLTAGTLVEGSMLQDDMSTFCVAIKESSNSDLPAFGISFVDTATGQFFVTEFIDDIDLTKFETFVAQIRPQELLLEKGSISVKALRILKNNTGPTTLWNHLRSGTEFWTADVACREIDASGYFVSEDQDNLEAWPQVLRDSRDKEFLMSSFGALLQYLRTLKIERDLITIGNFSWYDPIQKATTLVLDGQSLINLEIFANSIDGSPVGTLFTLLNRCITPSGKRLFRQWVCHPLVDPKKINNRLDAVDSLNSDRSAQYKFTSSLSKLPDLERLISRIHAGRCRAQDFLRVIEGFEQIEYTMSLLGASEFEDGIILQLLQAMPDLVGALSPWRTAFDRVKARESGILEPEKGVEDDFDSSSAAIDAIMGALEDLLKKARRDLGCTAIVFKDIGKEVYQLEIPTKVKGIPKNWDQVSATAKAKRYYSPELRALVRALQEAQETHGQVVKEVAGRFFKRFDQDYNVWLGAVKITAQLDCLISLAQASYSLGEPSCRPQFVNKKRSVIEFKELRHPCMLPSVSDFIPNDIMLGGKTPNINLLTGANAAGKSTVLRMTCVAVIMAQIGCYVPCISARLTPVDRIMSRLGANDNIFAAQSTFFVELSETKKILCEATPRSLVILDELGRGTSSYDGVAVAQSVLHHIASSIGCTGFFATHYHSLAAEFAEHPEIAPKRMQIAVDDARRRITFLYKLEAGVAEGSFGMHCASMCGIPGKVVDRAEQAAREWEHTSRLTESLEKARRTCYIPLGMQSDVAWLLREGAEVNERTVKVLLKAIEKL